MRSQLEWFYKYEVFTPSTSACLKNDTIKYGTTLAFELLDVDLARESFDNLVKYLRRKIMRIRYYYLL